MFKITIELDTCTTTYEVPYAVADAIDTLLCCRGHEHIVTKFKNRCPICGCITEERADGKGGKICFNCVNKARGIEK